MRSRVENCRGWTLAGLKTGEALTMMTVLDRVHWVADAWMADHG